MDPHIHDEDIDFHFTELLSSSDNEVGSNVDNTNIPQCVGVERREWKNLNVVLLDDSGLAVAEGVCRNSDEMDCVDSTRLGLDHVGVLIFLSLSPNVVPPSWRFSLRRWHIRWVLYEGVSLYDHQRKHNLNDALLHLNAPARLGSRQYNSNRVRASRNAPPKKDVVITEESIREVATKDCCAKNCVQHFPREKIAGLRN